MHRNNVRLSDYGLEKSPSDKSNYYKLKQKLLANTLYF